VLTLALGLFLANPPALAQENRAAKALPGQVIVDPDNPEWLVYNRDLNKDGKLDPCHICGPGDPEGFLYLGKRNADGTRSGGKQVDLIDKVRDNGGNCIYMQMVRSHGGDARKDGTIAPEKANPFIDGDPSKDLDQNILNQWEEWFDRMDDNGIIIFLFFYDDGARIWRDSKNVVGSAEHSFINAIVNRFEHHKHLIWVVGEEHNHGRRVRAIAQTIKDADDHDHVVANHHTHCTTFRAYAKGCALDQFAIQYNKTDANELHSAVKTAWSDASGRYGLNMAENSNHYSKDRTYVRRKSWAAAMGGAQVMVYRMDISSTPTEHLQDCRYQQRFFEGTDVNRMSPHDELAYGGTQWVLAKPGQSYIAYASSLSGNIGLKNMNAGKYDFTWYDCTDGDKVTQKNVSVGSGDKTWSNPSGIGKELAVVIQKSGNTN
jgi:hypothetical protein